MSDSEDLRPRGTAILAGDVESLVGVMVGELGATASSGTG